MKKFKFLSLLLVLLLALSALVACQPKTGGDTPGKTDPPAKPTDAPQKEEVVVLEWRAMGPADQPDEAKVVEKVNEILKEKLPGIQLKMQHYGDYAAKFSTWLAGREEFDICWMGYAFNMLNEINKGALADITDYVSQEKTPNLWKETALFEPNYNSAKVDGKLYGIPNVQPKFRESSALKIIADYADYIDTSELLKTMQSKPFTGKDTYDIMLQYLRTAKEKGTLGTGVNLLDMNMMYDRGFDWILGDDFPAVIRSDDPECKVVNFYASEEYKTALDFCRTVFSEGLTRADNLTAEQPRGDWGNKDGCIMVAHNTNQWFNADAEGRKLIKAGVDVEEPTELDVMLLLCDKTKFRGVAVTGSEATYTSIPSTCKHIPEAMRFIDFLHSPEGKEAYNIICFGIEGEHYKKVADNRIEMLENSKNYGVDGYKFTMGNMYNCYMTAEIPDGMLEYGLNFQEKVLPTWRALPTFGLSLTTADFQMEMSQVLAVVKEYRKSLMCGVIENWEATLNEFNQKLNSAGLDKIIASCQKQVDDFLKK